MSAIRGPGGVFVLIARGTFSAAMMFAVDLEKHLAPVFVGEPTGSSPNHYGNSRRNRLENTGLTLRISTLNWRTRTGRTGETPSRLNSRYRFDGLIACRVAIGSGLIVGFLRRTTRPDFPLAFALSPAVE